MYEYFWVTGANDSVENYAALFSIALRNNDIQEVDQCSRLPCTLYGDVDLEFPALSQQT